MSLFKLAVLTDDNFRNSDLKGKLARTLFIERTRAKMPPGPQRLMTSTPRRGTFTLSAQPLTKTTRLTRGEV